MSFNKELDKNALFNLLKNFDAETEQKITLVAVGGTAMTLKNVADKVKAEKMTFRQAAATLGITYYEFVSLLDETQLVMQNTDLLKKCKDAISIKEKKGV
jgi:hypothetical protein